MGDPADGYQPRTRFFDFEYKLDPSLFPAEADRRRFSLLDKKLTLDPEIEAEIRAWRWRLEQPTTLEEMLRPNWSVMQPLWALWMATPAGAVGPQLPPPKPPPPVSNAPKPTPPNPPAAKGETPRPGELTDLLEAVYKLPDVQRLVKEAREEGMKQLRKLETEWKEAKPPAKVAMVSVGAIVAGGTIGTLMAIKPTREGIFKLVDGKDIPTPIDGLKFRLYTPYDDPKKGWGGGATVPLGVPGLDLSLKGRAQQGGPDLGVMLNFDVAEFLRKRK